MAEKHETDGAAIRLECVRLAHRHDQEPSQVIDRADALAKYILGDNTGNTPPSVPGDRAIVRRGRPR